MTTRRARLSVLVDARLRSGVMGGVEQFVVGLAAGLSELDGEGRFSFLCYAGETDWLEPHLGGRCELVTIPSPAGRSRRRARVRAAVPALAAAYDAVTASVSSRRPADPDAVLAAPPALGQRHRPDVVHFPWQGGFRTSMPNIYHPWDLQHEHLPHLFTRRQRVARRRLYSAMAQQATLVCVASGWVRRDVVSRLGLPEEKVVVVPPGPPTAVYERPTRGDIERTRARLRLPETFALYPAQTWPHKNHRRLFAALAVLRDRGLRIPLVCSGYRNDFFSSVAADAHAVGVDDQVSFVGFLEPLELQCLYALARLLVFPTLFEGWGFPVSEAFLAGVPVACSNVTSLPEQAGDAALLFNPREIGAIAHAVERVWTDEALRRVLVDAGRARVSMFSWVDVARAFDDHYSAIAAGAQAAAREARPPRGGQI